MTTFLNDEARENLIKGLTILGMPQQMAEEYADWPDDVEFIDIHLTALINQAADHRDRAMAGDESVMKYLLADVVILIQHMNSVKERGWDELQLPLMNEAMNGHNFRWSNHTLQ